MKLLVLPLAIPLLMLAPSAGAKTFQNSYVSFEMPNNWACLQEGVAWTCTSTNVVEAKEAVIVLAAKVAGPEDTIPNFVNHLKQPKKITTKVGTPMPSTVMYAQKRTVSGMEWVQAQHVGSEIQDYYTLYLATVKDRLAILISFSAEKTKIGKYNPIFDGAIQSIKIVANQQLLFPKVQPGQNSNMMGLTPEQNQPLSPEALRDVPQQAKKPNIAYIIGFLILGAMTALLVFKLTRRTKKPVAKKR
jgi:hypothetical protein